MIHSRVVANGIHLVQSGFSVEEIQYQLQMRQNEKVEGESRKRGRVRGERRGEEIGQEVEN